MEDETYKSLPSNLKRSNNNNTKTIQSLHQSMENIRISFNNNDLRGLDDAISIFSDDIKVDHLPAQDIIDFEIKQIFFEILRNPNSSNPWMKKRILLSIDQMIQDSAELHQYLINSESYEFFHFLLLESQGKDFFTISCISTLLQHAFQRSMEALEAFIQSGFINTFISFLFQGGDNHYSHDEQILDLIQTILDIFLQKGDFPPEFIELIKSLFSNIIVQGHFHLYCKVLNSLDILVRQNFPDIISYLDESLILSKVISLFENQTQSIYWKNAFILISDIIETLDSDNELTKRILEYLAPILGDLVSIAQLNIQSEFEGPLLSLLNNLVATNEQILASIPIEELANFLVNNYDDFNYQTKSHASWLSLNLIYQGADVATQIMFQCGLFEKILDLIDINDNNLKRCSLGAFERLFQRLTSAGNPVPELMEFLSINFVSIAQEWLDATDDEILQNAINSYLSNF